MSEDRGRDIPAKTAALVAHGVITIEGDAQFASMAASEGWQGDGSAGNPYKISGYDINGTGHRWSICVNDTRVHFEVANCSLHDGTDAGLELHNVFNASIVDVATTRTGSYGIVVVESHHNLFLRDICSVATYGIYIWTSSNNTVEGSTCSQLLLNTALYMSGSDYNTIISNDFSSDPASQAVALVDSDNNNVSDNTLWWSGIGVDLESSSKNNTILNNTFGGNSVAIRVVSSPDNQMIGNHVSGDISAVSIISSSGILVHDNSQGRIGLSSSRNCIVTNNDCDFGGIGLGGSSWNLIANNNCSYVPSGSDGIHLESSDNNTIRRNNCSFNSYYSGIAVPWPDGSGIFSLNSGNNTIMNNTCLSNYGSGIWGFGPGTYGNVITGNNCSYNHGMYGTGGNGIGLYSQLMSENVCIGNTQYGISGGSVMISDNLCMDNPQGGISLSGTLGLWTLAGNVLLRNGIVFTTTDPNAIDGWTIDTTNTVNGLPVQFIKDQVGGSVPAGAGQVILVSCSNVEVRDEILNNATRGLQLFACDHLTIRNNTCSYNMVGMRLSEVSNCSFFGNAIYDNDGFGITVGGVDNTFWNNTFARNNGAAEVYSPLHIQVSDDYRHRNHWNTTQSGNYWSDWVSPDALPPYGIVDQPYVIGTSPLVQDFLPLTAPLAPVPAPIPEFDPVFLVLGLLGISLGLAAMVRRERHRT